MNDLPPLVTPKNRPLPTPAESRLRMQQIEEAERQRYGNSAEGIKVYRWLAGHPDARVEGSYPPRF